MKIIVQRSSLEDAVKNLCKVINQKNALPILGDILFDVNEKAKIARLTASDAEVIMTHEIALSECEGGGKFCVDATRLKDALGGLSEQPVTILAYWMESDQRFTIQHSSGETYFPLEGADEYPMPTEEKYNETLGGVKSEWMRDAMKRSLWATDDNDLRPVMNGVSFALVDGNLDIVASDGHVLVKSQYHTMVDEKRCGSFIMPRKMAKILGDIAEEGDFIGIEWNGYWAHIDLLGMDITFRLIEGKYPNYNAIIPKDQPLCATVDRSRLLNGLHKVIPFTADNQGAKMVRMHFEGEELKVSGNDYDFITGATDSMAIDYDGDTIEIGVSGSRLKTVLQKIGGQEVCISMQSPDRAIVIEPSEQEDDYDVLMLAMPMLLND
jgi:DNA polymerase-3 subunit beta